MNEYNEQNGGENTLSTPSYRLPRLALVGRPNVGKSTLFNALTRSRDSIVSDTPGLTRDRNYGLADLEGRQVQVIDTGGLLREEEADIDFRVDKQAREAVIEADVVVLVVDAREGLTAVDESIVQELRRSQKPLIVAVNKTDFADPDVLLADFYALGFANVLAIAAVHRRGLRQLGSRIIELLDGLPEEQFLLDEEEAHLAQHELSGIALAVVGRPNAGKSTLLNRLIGEERLVASPVAGTTRDAIAIPYTDRDGETFTLIDTAGIRRRARVSDKVEKFSVVKSLDAIDRANVVLLLLDAHEGVSDQDAHLLGEIVKRGRALIIAINKWDHLDEDQRRDVQTQFERKLRFVDYAQVFYISALHGSNIRQLLPAVKKVYHAAMRELSTNKLTEALNAAYRRHQPPLVNGYAIKLQYAHQGGRNPPHIIIHGSRTTNVPASYEQYLSKFFRRHFQLDGTPVRISFRDKHNPYNERK
ncbi:ribosome biogenesis GTPase Der [Suttonella sp. R2A3]|uniref:ribosome biogenesis GTPase Der n=1 Tax=Suttonella sp. R2A3 TaxID=2908648 RepID=UPI001F02E7EE|nr:ribosome biogenesis GTPase Der [Suttonella sp. R2A3]UJF23798.1 ribosome biogenesis GTPase Der [Suttonella sp. R2A3]